MIPTRLPKSTPDLAMAFVISPTLCSHPDSVDRRVAFPSLPHASAGMAASRRAGTRLGYGTQGRQFPDYGKFYRPMMVARRA